MGRPLAGSGQAAELIARQRSPAFKNDLPRVIRPDLLLTETGLAVTELDSVPGGIGLTAWLNQPTRPFPIRIRNRRAGRGGRDAARV
jgi:hypothetical protein